MLSFLFKRRTQLQKALARYRRTGDSWSGVSFAYFGFDRIPITNREEVMEVAMILACIEREPARFHDPQGIGYLIEQVVDDTARALLVAHAQPILLRLIARRDLSEDLVMPCLRGVMALGDAAGLECFCHAAATALYPDSMHWGMLLTGILARPEMRKGVATRLAVIPLVPALAIRYLDFANTLCREHGFTPHPSDTEAGIAALQAMVDDPGHGDGAILVAASIPFLVHPGRQRLLATCADHRFRDVRLEAAWAAARLGDPTGIQTLVRECADPVHASRPLAYLKELHAFDALPKELRDARFQALVEMAGWLGHEMEYGRPPSEVSIYDDRVLRWPPEHEPRRMFLVRYRYSATEAGGTDEVGVGMVGTSAFALMGTVTHDLAPEDIYAIHCCWELGLKDEKTGKYAAAQGRAILAQHNDGFA